MHGYPNSLICVFYLDNNQFNNGDKISKLHDKKSFFPLYDAKQSVESRKPTADDDYFIYLYLREKQCLTVDYNLNGKNNLHVFIVFRIIGYGSGYDDIFSFPHKASPVTLNFSVLSVHYNSVQVNDSLVYCNGI